MMRTPDVTCECGHRNLAHGLTGGRYEYPESGMETGCVFCDCEKFVPRDRSIPSQPVQFAGTHAHLPIHRQVARKNEDAT